VQNNDMQSRSGDKAPFQNYASLSCNVVALASIYKYQVTYDIRVIFL